MKKLVSLVTLTSITATFIALCAAVFSVTGISKLFAGAALSAAVMASALELGKIVSISFLYQYWDKISKGLKAYLVLSSMVLMLITSAGIYGYLSSAYAKVAATPLTLNADIQTVQGRVSTVEQDIKRKEDRLNQLITLRSQQETRLDQMVSKSTTGNSTTIRAAQTALNQADKNVTTLQREITNLSVQRDSLNAISIEKRVAIETNGDIGTFVYIAKILDTDLDTVVKWFTLILVLVFDPLAVALVIAVNFLIKHDDKTQIITSSTISESQTTTLPIIVESQEIIPTTNTESRDIPPEEPYQIYVNESSVAELPPQETAEQEVLKKYLNPNGNGIPDFMEPDFNWDDTSKWINNPIARLYKQKIVNKS
jgi:hypothetical protein